MKAHWAVSYISSEGFECILSIEGDDTNKVLAEGKRVMAEMAKHGVKPLRSRPAPPEPYREVKRQ